MNPSSRRGRADSIRSSVDALTATSGVAQAEFDQVAELVQSSVERVALMSAPAWPRSRRSQMHSAVHEIGAEMARVLGEAHEQVAGAIDAETDELEALLRDVAVTGSPPVNVAGRVDGGAEAGGLATGGVAPDAGPPAGGPPAGGLAPADGPSDAGPDDDDPPPLPPLDDIAAERGTEAWAAAVVDRYPRLTVDEVLAIYHYTTVAGVRRMNDHLRYPERTPDAERSAIEKLVANAISGLSKLPKRPGITYRGTDIPERILPLWREGEVVTDRAFYSSSIEELVAEGFRCGGNAFITIFGLSGVDVQKLSYFDFETEILFKPGTEFRVLSREWDHERQCWIFRIEEIAQ